MARVLERPHGIRNAMLTAVVTALLFALAVPAGGAAQPATWLVPIGEMLPAGARVVGQVPVAGALVVTSSAAPAQGVRTDTPLTWKNAGLTATDGEILTNGTTSTGAPDVWDTERGAQAVVALVDTGVAPVSALDGAVAGEINFSGSATGGDGYGHGTFLASLIAGRDAAAPGVAPEAGILSLKVADAEGATDVLKVLGALQWLHGPGRASGITVAVLALGVDPDSDAAVILDQAVERLAKDGLLVVTAAGNEGAGNLSSPATAVGSFSAGAVDASGTPTEWTSTGIDRAGLAQPDISALGVSVVGSMPPDSVIGSDPEHSDGYTPEGYFTGSGTSMSTALVAGVAALAHSARPDLDGAALDAALRAGGDTVNAPAALTAVTAASAAPGNSGNAPNGNADTNGHGPGVSNGNGKGPEAAPADPNSVRWKSVRWKSVRWKSVRWKGDHWGDADWGPAEWGSVRWKGNGWAGADFNANAWNSVRWKSVRWKDLTWTSVRWKLIPAE